MPSLLWDEYERNPVFRLRYEDALDILLRSGVLGEKGLGALTVRVEEGPRQPYYMWMSGADRTRWFRVGMRTKDVSFQDARGEMSVEGVFAGMEGLGEVLAGWEGGGAETGEGREDVFVA